MSASIKPVVQVAVLRSDVSVEELARALEFTNLAVSKTLDPCVFVISLAPLALPAAVEFDPPAFIRRQAN